MIWIHMWRFFCLCSYYTSFLIDTSLLMITWMMKFKGITFTFIGIIIFWDNIKTYYISLYNEHIRVMKEVLKRRKIEDNSVSQTNNNKNYKNIKRAKISNSKLLNIFLEIFTNTMILFINVQNWSIYSYYILYHV